MILIYLLYIWYMIHYRKSSKNHLIIDWFSSYFVIFKHSSLISSLLLTCTLYLNDAFNKWYLNVRLLYQTFVLYLFPSSPLNLTAYSDLNTIFRLVLCPIAAWKKRPLGKSEFYPLITNIHKNLLAGLCNLRSQIEIRNHE